ncbi:hypothetical protein [Caulobacter sp. NIBR2454]|uniref:hypothetical protein n=1 Tax=Caulobacter sp. NIBR2454 TaxID=3015996 RepID=UPI0022B65041|nr:hypothetical protein [Caulobacter sp. NIBR2454]
MAETRIAELTKVFGNEGQLLFYTTPRYARGRSSSDFIRPHLVPGFEGLSGWFELERFREGGWTLWRALRQVDRPAWAK